MNRFAPIFDNPEITLAVNDAHLSSHYDFANLGPGVSARAYTAYDNQLLDSAPEALESYLDFHHLDNA